MHDFQNIELKNVYFKFEKKKNILENINIKINKVKLLVCMEKLDLAKQH